MSGAAAIGLLLLQAAAASPEAAPAPTPSPTPRPVSAGPRTLQDVARERRLLGTTKGKGSVGTISVGPSTSSPAPAKTPGAAATAPAGGETPGLAPAPAPLEPSGVDVRVVSVKNDGIVDGAGVVRVNGTIRNAGYKSVCNVVVGVKINDNKGFFLASGQTAPDVNLIPPGEIASFHAQVQAPPGVRGARTNPDRHDVSEGSTSMGGDWKLLGGSEANVLSASEECGGR